MAERTELESETEQSPESAADLLREVADEISADGAITVEGDGASMTVPGTADDLDTELEVEHRVRDEYDQVAIEIDLEWTIIPTETDEDRPESTDRS